MTTKMPESAHPRHEPVDLAMRGFGLAIVGVMAAFLVNNYLNFWQG